MKNLPPLCLRTKRFLIYAAFAGLTLLRQHRPSLLSVPIVNAEAGKRKGTQNRHSQGQTDDNKSPGARVIAVMKGAGAIALDEFKSYDAISEAELGQWLGDAVTACSGPANGSALKRGFADRWPVRATPAATSRATPRLHGTLTGRFHRAAPRALRVVHPIRLFLRAS
jgi:hypothetical protein